MLDSAVKLLNTLFCRLRNELDRKYAPIRMQFECSQQIVWKGITVEGVDMQVCLCRLLMGVDMLDAMS